MSALRHPSFAAGKSARFTLRSTASAAMVLVSGLLAAGLAAAQEAPIQPETLETVVISGARKSAESAQLIKMRSDQVVDSIVAEDIGKFPDKNVAEILGRVTGVQIQRGNGEAGNVIIRGLGGVVTLLNGREFFSDSGRSLYLADVPATMLQRIDVYKTQEVSLPEGGTAGVIDVRTNRPFDFKGPQLFVNGRIENRDKAEVNNPDLSTMASNRWKTDLGEFGALVGLSYQRGQYHDERAWLGDPEIYKNADVVVGNPTIKTDVLGSCCVGRVLDLGDRKRLAGNLALQWKPRADMEFFAEGFATEIDHEYQQSFLVAGVPWWGLNNTVITTKPGTINLDTIYNTNYDGWGFTSTQAKHDEASNKQFAIGGHWDVNDRLRLSTELANTRSSIDWVNRILDTGYTPHNTIAMVRDGGGFIDYPAMDLTKASNFRINGGVDVRGRRSGDSLDWRGDAVFDLGEGFFREVSGGLRLAERKAMSINTSMPWTTSFAAVGKSVADFPGIHSVSPSTWGDFGVKQYVYADRDWLLGNGEDFRKMLTGSTALTAYDPMTLFDDVEKTSAAYGRTKFGFKAFGVPVTGVAGVRVVRTEQHLTGNSRNAETGVITPVDIDTSRTDALPSLALRAELTPKLIARLVAGQTIERPSFADYNPGVTYTPPGGGVPEAVP